MFLPAGPLLVADQLPDSNPVKKSALKYKHLYEAKYGAGTMNTFRSEEHTSELQSLMRISYAVFCLKKKINIISLRTQYLASTYIKQSPQYSQLSAKSIQL